MKNLYQNDFYSDDEELNVKVSSNLDDDQETETEPESTEVDDDNDEVIKPAGKIPKES